MVNDLDNLDYGRHAFITKSIVITEDNQRWIKKHFINLSRFVQEKIEDEMHGDNK